MRETIRMCMTFRLPKAMTDLIAALTCCVAVVVFSLSNAAGHPPKLHATAFLQVPPSLGSDHGDHSHDDLDQYDQAQDHHHADHSHEKAGFTGALASPGRIESEVDFAIRSDLGVSGLQDRLERPPRMA
ncbi:MAG: hypothetical protein J0H80_02540 [Rhizobiales bacterium]|nr:hypothetical protein [Hyphomicrobiales bacterium]